MPREKLADQNVANPHSFANFVDQHFVHSYWDKKPARISLPDRQSICDELTLLGVLKRYSEIPAQLKRFNQLAEFVTGVNCVATEKPIQTFAIQSDEPNLDAYLKRVNDLNSPNEWSIAYFGLHGASEVIWDSAKIFIKKLSAELGYRPGGRVDVDCFIGRYSSTPSGVHVDDAHNFGFTLRSGKTMYTWDPSHSQVKWLKSPAYDPYKQNSIPLANDPGFVCYFPHDSLHVGETKERPSVNVNISFWKESEPSKDIHRFLQSRISSEKLIRNKVQKDGVLRLTRFRAADLEQLRESIQSGSLETYLAMNDLLEQTTFGLRVPRPVFTSEPLDFDKPVRLTKSATINWYASERLKNLLIGVNGHCVSSPKDDDVIAFLEEVSSGSDLIMRDLTDHGSSDLSTLAQQFHDWGAFSEAE